MIRMNPSEALVSYARLNGGVWISRFNAEANARNQFSTVAGSTWLTVFANRSVRRSYSTEDTLDGIPVHICNVLEAESMPLAGRLQPRCAVDEGDCTVDTGFSRRSKGNIEMFAAVLVEWSRTQSGRLVSGATAAHSQRRS